MKKVFTVTVEYDEDPEGIITSSYIGDAIDSFYDSTDDVRYAEIRIDVSGKIVE